MMKRMFILVCIVTTSLCYGMEEEDPFSVQKISNPDDIEQGLKLVWNMAIKMYEKDISKELKEFRKKRLPHLVSLLNEKR